MIPTIHSSPNPHPQASCASKMIENGTSHEATMGFDSLDALGDWSETADWACVLNKSPVSPGIGNAIAGLGVVGATAGLLSAASEFVHIEAERTQHQKRRPFIRNPETIQREQQNLQTRTWSTGILSSSYGLNLASASCSLAGSMAFGPIGVAGMGLLCGSAIMDTIIGLKKEQALQEQYQRTQNLSQSIDNDLKALATWEQRQLTEQQAAIKTELPINLSFALSSLSVATGLVLVPTPPPGCLVGLGLLTTGSLGLASTTTAKVILDGKDRQEAKDLDQAPAPSVTSLIECCLQNPEALQKLADYCEVSAHQFKEILTDPDAATILTDILKVRARKPNNWLEGLKVADPQQTCQSFWDGPRLTVASLKASPRAWTDMISSMKHMPKTEHHHHLRTLVKTSETADFNRGALQALRSTIQKMMEQVDGTHPWFLTLANYHHQLTLMIRGEFSKALGPMDRSTPGEIATRIVAMPDEDMAFALELHLNQISQDYKITPQSLTQHEIRNLDGDLLEIEKSQLYDLQLSGRPYQVRGQKTTSVHGGTGELLDETYSFDLN